MIVNPFKYIQQVRSEVSKIIWPSRRETITTTVMVFVMATIVAIFFFLIDTVVGSLLELILRLAS
jgi:preprotein translocase subunit SecE